MRTIPKRRAVTPPSVQKRIITPAQEEFSVAIPWRVHGAVTLNGAWNANDPIALPFALSEAAVVYQLGWYNGSGVQSGNVDIGIYDTAWNRKVSGGGTAAVGASVWQWVDVTDTPLPSGRYYLAIVRDAAVTHAAASSPSVAAILSLYGVMDSTTAAYPLPDPLTNMVAAATFNRPQIGAIAIGRAPF